MAGIGPNPGPTEKFIFRYQYLLVKIGTRLIRRLFDVKVGHDFANYLVSNTTVAQTLQNLIKAKKITPDQAKYLPPIDMKPDSSNFDMTLLTSLLRNVCGLKPPNDPVWMNPSPTDTSEEANIAKLRLCRNWLMHGDDVVLPEAEFDAKWKELSVILVRLNTACGTYEITDLSELIDTASTMDTDKELKDQVTTIQEDMKLKSFQSIREKLIMIYQRDCRLLQVSPFIEDDNEDLISIYQSPTLQRTIYDRDFSNANQDSVFGRYQTHAYQDKVFGRYQTHAYQDSVFGRYQTHAYQDSVFGRYQTHAYQDSVFGRYQTHAYQDSVFGRYQTKGKQENTLSYEEIFCKDGKKFKHVYITGDAGVGKTSLCKRMCLLWSKSRSGDYAGNDESTKRDIKYLEKFDFLFHVTLGATRRRDIVMMIVDQLFYSECDDERTDMHKLIKRILNQYDSLIVLDGYDEWNPETSGKQDCKTPKGIESEKCVFLTTCRPYKLENVRLSGSDIDQQIEMSGIHGLSSQHYVVEVVKYMNKKTHDNKNAYQFLKEIKQCELYDQLCIPMISSHLVVVWWSNQQLTHFSKAFLYGKILEMMFKRAEKKVEFPSLPQSDLKLPKCFSQLDYVNEHVSLLQKVGLLSFNSLFKQDECASTLVFTRKQLMSQPYVFTSDEMDFLCKIGIISKNKVIGCFEDQKQILSFVHKSYIEFFSALYFSSFDACNMMDGVVKNWNSLDDVLQYQNFFQFLAGLSGVKLNFLLENIYSLLSDHLELWRKYAVLNYKFHKEVFFNSYREQLSLFQTAVIKCFIEVRKSNDPNIALKLHDFIFGDISNIGILKKLLLLNSTNVKSIHSVDGKYYDEFDQIQNLQCLLVGAALSGDVYVYDYVYDDKFTECMLQNQSTLHTIGIEGDNTLIPELPVRSLQHLASLSLTRVKMPHNSLHNLVTSLSGIVLIEIIQLCDVRCDQHHHCILNLNLPCQEKLTTLYLYDVSILCNNVNTSSLKCITLRPLLQRIVSCNVFNNCIKDSKLEYLNIMGDYLLDKTTMEALADTVYTLPYIKSLTLELMELPDDVLLQLHPHVTQLKIELESVTLSRQCFHCFIESCVNNKSVIKVKLDRCKITLVDGVTHRVLSYKESVVYMSEYLTSKPTVNITYKHDTWLRFETGSCQ